MRPVTVTVPVGTPANGGAVSPLPDPVGIQPRSTRIVEPSARRSGTRISKPTVEFTDRSRATIVWSGSYVPRTVTRVHSCGLVAGRVGEITLLIGTGAVAFARSMP